ncbi:hypothetical protein AVEN_209302-1 [Araneus ventricosus]|uniref:Uncharacterized protein n=1 Tax=Araneus ventricosus TaxID=182803 RepID=A0A4Y2CB96_ARAVE|nr:hypothetical protein AVEN_209302-1 [Araneus ventricosus]
MKLVPQSLNNSSCLSLLAAKRFKAAMKQSDYKSPSISKCTVTHTNTQAYVFMCLIPLHFQGFTWRGPLKSTPTLEKALLEFIRDGGRSTTKC